MVKNKWFPKGFNKVAYAGVIAMALHAGQANANGPTAGDETRGAPVGIGDTINQGGQGGDAEVKVKQSIQLFASSVQGAFQNAENEMNNCGAGGVSFSLQLGGTISRDLSDRNAVSLGLPGMGWIWESDGEGYEGLEEWPAVYQSSDGAYKPIYNADGEMEKGQWLSTDASSLFYKAAGIGVSEAVQKDAKAQVIALRDALGADDEMIEMFACKSVVMGDLQTKIQMQLSSAVELIAQQTINTLKLENARNMWKDYHDSVARSSQTYLTKLGVFFKAAEAYLEHAAGNIKYISVGPPTAAVSRSKKTAPGEGGLSPRTEHAEHGQGSIDRAIKHVEAGPEMTEEKRKDGLCHAFSVSTRYAKGADNPFADLYDYHTIGHGCVKGLNLKLKDAPPSR